MSFIQRWCEQKAKRAIQQLNEEPKYKATYRCLHCGKTKEFLVREPDAISRFLQEGDGIWEAYMLTHIVKLNEDDSYEP